MKKYTLGFGLSAVVLLTGCGTAEEAKVESPESEVQGEQTSAEVTTASETKEEKEVALESPYKEIKEHFDNYELPEEGVVKANEGKSFAGSIEYENGYTFNSETKALDGRSYSETEGPEEPTEGQKTGVAMGWLVDAAAMGEFEDLTISNSSEQMSHPISRLNQVKELTDFEPLDKWATETIAILDKAQNMEAGDERQAVLKEGYDELQKMNSLIVGE